MRLNTKIVIVILEIGLIPLLLFGFIGYFNTKQQIVQNTFTKLDAIAQIQKNRMQEILKNQLNPRESEINNIVNDYTGLGDTGETLLVKNDGKGNALFLTAIRFDKNAAFTRVVSKEKTNVAAVRAIQGIEGIFNDVVDYRNVPVFAVTRYIESVHWGIVVKIDQAEALAPVKKLEGLFLFLIAMTGFFTILIGISISRSITNPIKNLMLMTDQLTKEFSTTTTTTTTERSKDEIGLLKQAFSSMVVKLKESYTTLEQKVRDRTKDLQNVNMATQNVLEDLSVEKSKVEMARAKEEAILMSIGDGIIATDIQGNITLINKTAEKLFGKKSEEVVGKSFFEVIVIEDEKGVSIPLEKRPVKMALAGGTTTTSPTYYYVRPDKTKFPVAIMVTPIILDGKIIGTIEIFRDITKEKEIDKAKSEFVSLASHQLKTPPTAIKLLTERLLGDKMGTLTEKQKEYINDIHSENERSIELVNALLNVSRIEMGAFTIQLNEKNICAVAQSVLYELKSFIDKKRLKLEEIYPKKNTAVLIDEPLFRMVVSNLVMNAVNYTADGGTIQVECREVNKGQVIGGKLLAENSFTIIISDTGYGIPKNQQDKLFTKFFRADNAREKHTDGTGLGLYIVKSILDNSGGSIWFTSEENKGTTFYVAIPVTGMKNRLGKKELIV